jgi:hypothetical protein
MDSEWLLEKYCRFGPMNMRSPSSSSTDAWKSRVSITMGLMQSRWMSAECSKLALSNV